ncbi:hypothetical protein HXX76_012017 [Chlamydomonas incerta]|uniref:Uncharacterized protein n=1 Tax=Chlamydomonas incerta TaxID=51695 RepID=A0A835SIY9_CHLIN|nr:hypothetical protein HXX76_012017 [Chlamydomonas incerta]|eukprot:KAG2428032.1 hypothetical protein HXX76_012017 [Chlamydomonas incerta]
MLLGKGLGCPEGEAPFNIDGAVSATCGRSAWGCRAPGAVPGEVSLTLGVRRPAAARLLPGAGSAAAVVVPHEAAGAATPHGRSLLNYVPQPCQGAVLYDSATGSPVPHGTITGPVYAGADQQLVGTATLTINSPPGGYMTFTLVRIPSPDFPNSPFWSTDDALWQLYTDLGSLGAAIDAPGCSRPNQLGATFNHVPMTGNIGTFSFIIPYSRLGLTLGSCDRKRFFIIIKTGVAGETAFLSWDYMTKNINQFPELCTSVGGTANSWFGLGPVYAGADQQLVGTATLYPNTPSPGYITFTMVRIPSPDFPSSPFWSTDDALWQLYTDLGSLGAAIDVGAAGTGGGTRSAGLSGRRRLPVGDRISTRA